MEVEHEYEEGRQTAVELRYLPYKNTLKDPNVREQIARDISGETIKKREIDQVNLKDKMDPHQGFVDSYNLRALEEQKNEIRKKTQELYNEKGQRYGRLYDQDGFKKTHDPLSIININV
jgi:hypothetical protein